MADGDYTRSVISPSADEVGRLAVAFNHMAAELAEVDRQRRDLVANVSHELRTPISALRATLENVVDGVVPADPELLRTMLGQTERLQRLVTQLLDLSRLESGGSPLHPRGFPVADLLDAGGRRGSPPLARPADSWSTSTRRSRGRSATPSASTRSSPTSSRTPRASRPTGEVLLRGHERRPRGDRGARRRPGHPRGRQSTGSSSASTGPTRPAASDDGGAGLGLAIAQWIVDLHGGTHPRRSRAAARRPARRRAARAVHPGRRRSPAQRHAGPAGQATRPPAVPCSPSHVTHDPTHRRLR